MYRNLLIAIIIAIFAGCSAPKPKQPPSWYTNLPKDYKNFYAVASANSQAKAKNLALHSLRKNINIELDALFKNSNNKLSPTSKRVQEILKSNSHLSNKLSFRSAKIEKSEVFNGETLILISISKKKIFEKVQLISDAKFNNLKREYNTNKDAIAIKRFAQIQPLMTQYAELASASAAKDIALSSYSSNANFRVLKELSDEYDRLRSTISFYILSDGNSRIYTKWVREAIEKSGLKISKKMKDSNTLKLLISSTTTNSIEYTFNKSKNLVKLTTFDSNKKKIAFRQHTVIGKSRKNNNESKQQAAINFNAKMNKLGIFNFIGI